MIIDAQRFTEPAEISGSIAIIGGGAAGIVLAMELAKHFQDVLLLESGGVEFDLETQNLYDGSVLGHTTADLDSSRLRFLGGTTNHWNGQCAPLDSVDFERIPGRPHSGWPFSRDELIPYYQRAYRYCELGEYRATSTTAGQAESAMRQIVESSEFEVTEFHYSPPTRFGERYRSDLQSSNRIKVYLHANVIDISISDNGSSVASVDVSTLADKRFRVKASAYILCCGGIENARILLNCTRFFKRGIGNDNDLVGRFFMDHLTVEGIGIAPRIEDFNHRLIRRHQDGDMRVGFALKNSADVVRRTGRRSCSLFLSFELGLPRHLLQARASPAYTALKQLVSEAASLRLPQDPSNTGCAVLGDLESVATALSHRLTKFLGEAVAVRAMFGRLEGEQSPTENSRVVLIDEVDALGVRRAGLDWKITAEDRDNLYQTAMALARGVGAAGFGRVSIPMQPGDNQSMISTTWHHMGTTRMHDDSRQGVVDRHCRVHGLANFFVAGSSVFPTGGRVNPTLTIVALAIRLADHLKLTVKPA